MARRQVNQVAMIDRFIPRDSPLARAGGARMLMRVTGGNAAGAAALAAISAKESQFGKTSGRWGNNFWGWGVHAGPAVNSAPTVEAMAGKVWRGLNSGLYRGAGLTTLPAILNRYAPPSENNTELYKRQAVGGMRQMGFAADTNIFQGSAATTGSSSPRVAAGAVDVTGVSGSLDTKRLMMLLGNQRARSLRGLMPTAGYQRELSKIADQALPRAQIVAQSRGVGAGAAAVAESLVGAAADASSKQAINAARQYLGTPYSWGGGTPSGPTRGFGRGASTVGFDCSSLVQMAWAKAGIKLPRTTYDQIKAGVAVPNINQARPGDLLFPSRGHVQMYLGGGKVIEAPRTGGHVQIVPIRSSYIAIRRPGAR